MLKRKDDIRRRLTIAEVPKPPVDLVQKIKRDIPKHYTSRTSKAVTSRKRDSAIRMNFWGLSWQLAAGILVLVGMTWAVFETWQSEMKSPAQVAESATESDTMSDPTRPAASAPEQEPGDAVDSQLSEASSVNEETPVVAEAFRDQIKDQDPNRKNIPADAPAAPPAPLEEQSFAAEVPAAIAARREKRDDEAAPPAIAMKIPSTDERNTESKGVETGMRARPSGEPVGGTLGRAGSTVANEAAEPESITTERATSPKLQAGMVAKSSEADAVRQQLREVEVVGLDEERVVRVELRIATTGKVVEVDMPDITDARVKAAVKKAAMEWQLPAETDQDGKKERLTTKVIEVQLRKAGP